MSEQYMLLLDDNYCVLELSTGLVISRFAKSKCAKKLKDKLETGCGFQGNTPPFFIRNVKQVFNVWND